MRVKHQISNFIFYSRPQNTIYSTTTVQESGKWRIIFEPVQKISNSTRKWGKHKVHKPNAASLESNALCRVYTFKISAPRLKKKIKKKKKSLKLSKNPLWWVGRPQNADQHNCSEVKPHPFIQKGPKFSTSGTFQRKTPASHPRRFIKFAGNENKCL